MINGNAPFVTDYPAPTARLRDREDSRRRFRAGHLQRVTAGGQMSLPWRLSRSVIDSVGPAGAEFARNAG